MPFHPSNERNPDRREPLRDSLFNLAWEAYHEAGQPFGPSLEALLVWLRFGQDTTAN